MSQELRARLAAGDKAALAEAYRAYRRLVLRVLHERRRAPADFDDLLQEAFLLLPRCARMCRPATSLAGCVATAAIHACRAYDCRAATSDQTQPGRPSRRVAADTDLLLSNIALPHQELLLRARPAVGVHLVSELLETMPAGQRAVLWAREVEGLGVHATAARLGVSPASVGTLTLKARRALERRAADGPLAEEFAAMPRPDTRFRGSSRSARWRRRNALAQEATA